VAELGGEKIDVIPWSDDPDVFVANALSPAQVVAVEIDEEERIASVTVPERMLSLAIGREGQNARLAAKLTGWRIDIRSEAGDAPTDEAGTTPTAEPGEPETAEVATVEAPETAAESQPGTADREAAAAAVETAPSGAETDGTAGTPEAAAAVQAAGAADPTEVTQ
jgi:N utilization substance protein A